MKGFILVGCMLLLVSMGPSESVSLTIKVVGLDGKKGKLVIALYRSSDDFPSASSPYKYALVSVSSLKNSAYKMKGLPKNTYAIAVYQDVNENNKLDKNFLGVPTERYGFSNNARGTFSAPSFAETSVKLQTDKTISIQIQ